MGLRTQKPPCPQNGRARSCRFGLRAPRKDLVVLRGDAHVNHGAQGTFSPSGWIVSPTEEGAAPSSEDRLEPDPSWGGSAASRRWKSRVRPALHPLSPQTPTLGSASVPPQPRTTLSVTTAAAGPGFGRAPTCRGCR